MEYQGNSLKILSAARDLFSEKGFKEATTKEIAEKAGVNETTLFRNFKSKENLFEEMFEFFIFLPCSRHFIDYSKTELKGFLSDIGNFLFEIYTRNEKLFVIELREGRPIRDFMKMNKYPKKVINRMIGFIVDNGYANEKDAELLAITFIASVHGLYLNLSIFKTFEREVSFKDSLQVLIDSIACLYSK